MTHRGLETTSSSSGGWTRCGTRSVAASVMGMGLWCRCPGRSLLPVLSLGTSQPQPLPFQRQCFTAWLQPATEPAWAASVNRRGRPRGACRWIQCYRSVLEDLRWRAVGTAVEVLWADRIDGSNQVVKPRSKLVLVNFQAERAFWCVSIGSGGPAMSSRPFSSLPLGPHHQSTIRRHSEVSAPNIAHRVAHVWTGL